MNAVKSVNAAAVRKGFAFLRENHNSNRRFRFTEEGSSLYVSGRAFRSLSRAYTSLPVSVRRFNRSAKA